MSLGALPFDPLDTLVWFVVLYTLAAPVVPWIFGPRRGSRGAWTSASIALLVLLLLNVALLPACIVAGCGQGAIGVVLIWKAAAISAGITLASALAAAYVWRR